MFVDMKTRDKAKLELSTFKKIFQTYFNYFKKPTKSKTLIENKDYFVIQTKEKRI